MISAFLERLELLLLTFTSLFVDQTAFFFKVNLTIFSKTWGKQMQRPQKHHPYPHHSQQRHILIFRQQRHAVLNVQHFMFLIFLDDPQHDGPLVPTMLRWPYQGNKVFVIGTFNNWKEKIPMTFSSEENCFVVILNMNLGKHQFRVF